MISSYNVWSDLIEVSKDLYGLTFAYSCEYDEMKKYVEGLVIPYFRDDNGPFKLIGDVEYKGGKYKAVHITVEYDPLKDHRLNEISKNRQPIIIEMHFTTIEQLAINDSIGEGAHTLYHKEKRREIEDRLRGRRKRLYDTFYTKIENLLGCLSELYAKIPTYFNLPSSPSAHN